MLCAALSMALTGSALLPVFAQDTDTTADSAADDSSAGIPSTLASAAATNGTGTVSLGSGTASIRLQGNANQTLVGKEFTVYQLFTAKNAGTGESVAYNWNSQYKNAIQTVIGAALKVTPDTVTIKQAVDYIQSLRQGGGSGSEEIQGPTSQFRYFIEDLKQEFDKEGLGGSDISVTSTTQDNAVNITGLDYGYYLITESSASLPEGQAVSLAMVTTANPSETINIKSDLPSIEKKVQEDSDDAWKDVADFEIGQLVPYRYTSTVPDINGYTTYKWAAHDKMNAALTFNPDSVVITISGTSGGNEKTYTLESSEFTVSTAPSDGCSYEITIPDLKAVVDTQFDNKNAAGDNTYGQIITVTYNATLNSSAADSIGQPIENDVRLEFSSNPNAGGGDDTNFTPWDKVVIYTFELDSLKVNEQGTKLEGAEFELYEDEACTKQIKVQAVTGGYAVINADTAGDAQSVTMTSDANGSFKIFGLDQGTYYLKEVAAPEGYDLLTDPIKIVITASYTDTDPASIAALSGTSSIGSVSTDLETSTTTGIINSQIVNQTGSKLPVTGSAATLTILAAGAGLVGWGVYENKRRSHK